LLSKATKSIAAARQSPCSLFVSLVYCAESTVPWFVAREKYCWMAADCADKSKQTGQWLLLLVVGIK
jgi:hypothetical protein